VLDRGQVRARDRRFGASTGQKCWLLRPAGDLAGVDTGAARLGRREPF
jgi:hypothetical protein